MKPLRDRSGRVRQDATVARTEPGGALHGLGRTTPWADTPSASRLLRPVTLLVLVPGDTPGLPQMRSLRARPIRQLATTDYAGVTGLAPLRLDLRRGVKFSCLHSFRVLFEGSEVVGVKGGQAAESVVPIWSRPWATSVASEMTTRLGMGGVRTRRDRCSAAAVSSSSQCTGEDAAFVFC